jgi:sarcosine oxidase, subunit gamma
MLEPATRNAPQVQPAEWLKAAPPALRFILHGNPSARAAAAPVWGAGFSETACRAVVQGPRATLWLGPEEYLLLGDASPLAASEFTIADALERAMGDLPHALVDVSHRQFALEVIGPQAATILSGACPLDLDIAEFPVGMCTRTVLAKADIVLWRVRENAFHLEVWRSFGGYVEGLLREIAHDVGF